MNIYVGNIPFELSEDQLRDAFGAYGEVTSVKLIMDRETGRPRGFGFVEMSDDEAGRKAVEALNGSELGGRTLKVNEAHKKEDRGFRGGGYDRR
jgi:RNA recognition motif-containing protein